MRFYRRSSPTALANLKAAGGELPYNKLWLARTEEWIGQHPVDALKITARHAWEFYFPPPWLWSWQFIPGVFKPAMTVDDRVCRVCRLGHEARSQGLALYLFGRSIASTDVALRRGRPVGSLPLPDRRHPGLPRCRHGLASGAVPDSLGSDRGDPGLPPLASTAPPPIAGRFMTTKRRVRRWRCGKPLAVASRRAPLRAVGPRRRHANWRQYRGAPVRYRDDP